MYSADLENGSNKFEYFFQVLFSEFTSEYRSNQGVTWSHKESTMPIESVVPQNYASLRFPTTLMDHHSIMLNRRILFVHKMKVFLFGDIRLDKRYFTNLAKFSCRVSKYLLMILQCRSETSLYVEKKFLEDLVFKKMKYIGSLILFCTTQSNIGFSIYGFYMKALFS